MQIARRKKRKKQKLRFCKVERVRQALAPEARSRWRKKPSECFPAMLPWSGFPRQYRSITHQNLLAKSTSPVSVCLSVCLSSCLSVCLSVCLPVCLSVCLPVCLPACLPVHAVFGLRDLRTVLRYLYKVWVTQLAQFRISCNDSPWLSRAERFRHPGCCPHNDDITLAQRYSVLSFLLAADRFIKSLPDAVGILLEG